MLGSPNILSFLSLFLWVPVTAWLFKRFRPAEAVIWAVLLSINYLPEVVAIDPPLLPPMDKTSMAALWCFIACLVKSPGRIKAAKPFRGIDILFIFMLIGNLGTSLTNGDTLVTGPIVRPALSLYDSFALSIKDTLSIYLPFFIGRAMIRKRADLADMTRILLSTGLVYTLLALFEIRMSPQLHHNIYGFHQMDFSMTLRFGGYRPMIFMQTGMAVSMYLLGSSLMAMARWRAGLAKFWQIVYLPVIVVICKSSGAVIYGILLWPLVLMSKRFRILVPAAFSLIALLYPVLRGTDVFPADALVEYAEGFNEERALSLWFRFDQEKQLMDRARERPLFGWGAYDRNRLFDPGTGEDLSITDGDWTIQLGTRGAIGFLGMYGMMTIPCILLFFRMRKLKSKGDRRLLAVLALFASTITIDLLPNGLFNCLPLFLSGALHGLSIGLIQEQDRRAKRERAEKLAAKKKRREGQRPLAPASPSPKVAPEA
ncbi:MAG: hypothetical protein ACI9KE_004610 [Polyangiales bacterium]|jgi:hypothetical protein